MSNTEEADAYDEWASKVQAQVDAAGAAVQAKRDAIKGIAETKCAAATQEQHDVAQEQERQHQQNVADEERRHREQMAKEEQRYQQQMETHATQHALDISSAEAERDAALADLPAIDNLQDQIRKARQKAMSFRQLHVLQGGSLLDTAPPAAASGGGGAVASSASSHKRNRSPEPEVCAVCMEKPKNATIVHTSTGTGHICCCFDCATLLKERGDNCPICRAPIDMVIKQFNN